MGSIGFIARGRRRAHRSVLELRRNSRITGVEGAGRWEVVGPRGGEVVDPGWALNDASIEKGSGWVCWERFLRRWPAGLGVRLCNRTA